MRQGDRGPAKPTGDTTAAGSRPSAHRGEVRRTRLHRLLRQVPSPSIISIVAPPGYGKTTLLAQWVATGAAVPAWVTIDAGHEDPVVLFTALARALYGQGVLDPGVFDTVSRPGAASYVMAGRLMSAIHDQTTPVRLVLDDLHLLTSEVTLDALGQLVARLPPAWQIALAGRDRIALSLARWRARGSGMELGPGELALDEREIASLSRRLGVGLSTVEVHELTKTSGGWPAIVYLALLAARRDPSTSATLVSGRQPTIADYLRSELLAGRSAEEITFLTRTAILNQLTGPLCDAVADRSGSDRVLGDLARSTLLVEDRGGAYQYHSLLREFLLDELPRREAGPAASHRRAATWYERNGQVDAAIEHAFAAGDLDHAAAMVGSVIVPYRWSGRRATTRAWLRRFSDDEIEQRPWLAVLAAIEECGVGDLPAAERLADIVDRAVFDGRPLDGTASLASGRAMLRALMCRSGVADQMANAVQAVELEPLGSRWRDVALWTVANGRLLAGDVEGADEALADAVAVAAALGNAGIWQVALGQRALLAIDRGDWAGAGTLADAAGSIVASAHLDGYQITAITRAAQARVAVHRGDVHAAMTELTAAVNLRPQLTATLPWLNVQALLALARAHMAVGDPSGAQTLLAQARDVVRLRPQLGSLPDEVIALQARVSNRPSGLAGATSLTAAELRVLQFLPLYLSFKEIGDRLGVKASTVQTHAVAIYGKLGASSRGEAVDLAIDARLLEEPPRWKAPSHHAWDVVRVEE